jgi:hypothetical protein
MLHRSPLMVEPYGPLGISQHISAAHNGTGDSALSPQAPHVFVLSAHSPPFHRRGAALPACIPLTDLCPPFCCYTGERSAEKGGLPVSPLQASWPHRNLACHVRSSPFFPLHPTGPTRCGIAASRYYPACISVNPRLLYGDDSIVLR